MWLFWYCTIKCAKIWKSYIIRWTTIFQMSNTYFIPKSYMGKGSTQSTRKTNRYWCNRVWNLIDMVSNSTLQMTFQKLTCWVLLWHKNFLSIHHAWKVYEKTPPISTTYLYEAWYFPPTLIKTTYYNWIECRLNAEAQ